LLVAQSFYVTIGTVTTTAKSIKYKILTLFRQLMIAQTMTPIETDNVLIRKRRPSQTTAFTGGGYGRIGNR
jgi:hypothetical protein